MVTKRVNAVVFGATGVTGKYVIREILKITKEGEQFTWAVAGRSSSKLKEALIECGCESDDIPIIVADIRDEQSINDMCRQAECVLNTVGPYALYGEIVVKACIANKTHHFDVSGEPMYLETMQLKYHKEAEEAGVYIIGACGFDSVPADMGVQFLKQNFEGDVNSVETYISVKSGPSGYKVGLGTWNSLINGISNATKLRGLRSSLCSEMFPEGTPKSNHKLQPRGSMFNSDIVNGWCVVFPGSDRSVITRSQMANYKNFKDRPVNIQTYLRVGKLINAITLAIMTGIFAVFTLSKCGRYLLKRFPGFFSLGMFHKDGPTPQQVAESSLKMTIVGTGWSEKLDGSEQHPDPPTKRVIVQLNGPDIGYILTSMALVQAGLTTLQEADKMPSTGGVFTTASGFRTTSFIDRLQKHGLSFEVIGQ